MTQTLDIREGLFRHTDRGSVLLASRHRENGKVCFPAVDTPGAADDWDTIELGNQGEVFSYTKVHMPGAHFEPGYCVGLVKMPEGVLVFTPLLEDANKPLRVGLPVNLEIAPLWQENQQNVRAYRFVPA